MDSVLLIGIYLVHKLPVGYRCETQFKRFLQALCSTH